MTKNFLLMATMLLLVTACATNSTPVAVQQTSTTVAVETATGAPTATATQALPSPTETTQLVRATQSFQPQLAIAGIPMDDVIALLPRDAIPAIFPADADEIMVSAQEANDSGMRGDERVIGVSINGESRAYPIPFLSRHEIVNTTIGGQKLAVTW